MSSILSLDEFKDCATILVACVGRPMPEDQLDAYLILLEDIPYPVLRAACIRSVQQMRANFVPAVGVIRDIAMELMVGDFPDASAEWQRTMDACLAYGFTGEKKAAAILGEFTWGVVKDLGWQSICQTEEPDITRSQFCKLYDSRAQKAATQRMLSPELRTPITGPSTKVIGGPNG